MDLKFLSKNERVVKGDSLVVLCGSPFSIIKEGKGESMGDKGKRDKGKREQQKKGKPTLKEKRKQKKR